MQTTRPQRGGRGARLMAGAVVLAASIAAAGPADASGVVVSEPRVFARLLTPTGADGGAVSFLQQGPRLRVRVAATGLTPGWHGFHIHTKGDCTVGSGPSDPFSAAGGHLGGAAGQTHGVSDPGGHGHDGDMPALFAAADGTANAAFVLDLALPTLFDADGAAVIVHANPDNLANIPTRYKYDTAPTDGTFDASGPDGPPANPTGSKATGDAGGRQRCGVVQVASSGAPGATFPQGLWMAARDGGVFALGLAPFKGSMAARPLNAPVIGLAPTASRQGYWLGASDGGVFGFGDAPFLGSAVAALAGSSVVGLAAPAGALGATLKDSSGRSLGGVSFRPEGAAVRVTVGAAGLSPGWHGLHVHTKGDCTVGAGPTDPFSTAGGHLGSGAGQTHGFSNADTIGHDGDLPPLLAGANGVATASFLTDNLTLAQLADADGSAVIVHAGGDNLGHIPAARYRSDTNSDSVVDGTDTAGADTTTKNTGDAGARQRCGLVTTTSAGYWLASRVGEVFAFGAAPPLGGMKGQALARPIVGMAATTSGLGYWLVGADGGVFAFGDAGFFGSTGALRLNAPIVGLVPTPSGLGYWLVGADGGVFAFGDAGFFGSAGGMRLNRAVTGIVPSASGAGYTLLGADGGTFNYGDGDFLGSLATPGLNQPVVGGAVER